MIKRCTENEILGKIAGVIGVNCAETSYEVTPASAETDINDLLQHVSRPESPPMAREQ